MGRNERAFAITLVCGFIGVILAIMIQLMNDAGMIIDEFITGTLLLREVQAFLIIIWLLLGVLISATQK